MTPADLREHAPLAIWPAALRERSVREQVAAAVIRARPDTPRCDGRPTAYDHVALRTGRSRASGVSVLPIRGTITPHPDIADQVFGYTNPAAAASALRTLAGDPRVSAIALDIDSPGGSVFGIPELGDAVAAAAKAKPVVAVANHVAASAAYWVAAQARRVYVSPSGQVGSVGVLWRRLDDTKAQEKAGLKTTYIHAGEFKTDGYGPMTEGEHARRQKIVDTYYRQFVSALARGRKVQAATVERDFGQGRMVLAREAVRLGMADKVGTLEDAVNELAAKPADTAAPASTSAAFDRPAPAAFDRAAILASAWGAAPTPARPEQFAAPSGEAGARFSPAVHESGHVIANAILGGTVHSAWCSADGGVCRGSAETVPASLSPAVNAAMLCAGGVAEQLFYPGDRGDPFAPGGSAAGDLAALAGRYVVTPALLAAGRRAATAMLSANAGAVARVARVLALRGYCAGPDLTAAAGLLKTSPG